MPSRSSAAPAKWTGMMSFVRGVIFSAVLSGVAYLVLYPRLMRQREAEDAQKT